MVLDELLELSIVGSFTRVGIGLRREVFGWPPLAAGSLDGRTVLITGPTSGLGRAATDALAALGARVILVGRNHERLAGVRDALVAAHRVDRFPIVVADMGSLASIRAAVTRILETESRLDVLIDNAGAIFQERTEGPDGIEATFATLVLGPFVLVSDLLQLLQRTPGSRVISVTSGGMYSQRLHLDDLQWRSEPFSGSRAYARAKRAQVALVREWARRLGPRGIVINAMHPGWVATPGLAESLPGLYGLIRPLLRTPAEGADTIVWLASEPAGAQGNGEFWHDRRSRSTVRLPWTATPEGAADRLWEWTAAHAGESSTRVARP